MNRGLAYRVKTLRFAQGGEQKNTEREADLSLPLRSGSGRRNSAVFLTPNRHSLFFYPQTVILSEAKNLLGKIPHCYEWIFRTASSSLAFWKGLGV